MHRGWCMLWLVDLFWMATDTTSPWHERFDDEKAVLRMAHGLLHALAAIHEVGSVVWVLIACHSLCMRVMTCRSDGHFILSTERPRVQLPMVCVFSLIVPSSPPAVNLLQAWSGLHLVHLLPLKAKFVYRDLRLENTACSVEEPRRWFLLDLECCATDGGPAPQSLRNSHVRGVLMEGCFTAASYLVLLGELLWRYEQSVTSAPGRQFLDAIHVPAVQQLVTRELLRHPWISCEGASCRDVGARPGER